MAVHGRDAHATMVLQEPNLVALADASSCGRADARPSRGCGPGVWCGALRAASRDGVALPFMRAPPTYH